MTAVQVSAHRFACARHDLEHPNYSIPCPLLSKGTTSEEKKAYKTSARAISRKHYIAHFYYEANSECLKVKPVFYMKMKQLSHVILSLLLLQFYSSFSSLLLALPELPL